MFTIAVGLAGREAIFAASPDQSSVKAPGVPKLKLPFSFGKKDKTDTTGTGDTTLPPS